MAGFDPPDAVYFATPPPSGEVALAYRPRPDLPEALARDADRMARFEREAHVLASLNHPNIAAVYGVEERAIVMELVEGADLSGPLPLETAGPLKIASPFRFWFCNSQLPASSTSCEFTEAARI